MKATPLKKGADGKLRSARAKVGGECSSAMSEWKTSGMTPAIAAILGKCRSKARQNKRAEQQQASGKLAAGRGTWQRSDKAKALVEARKAKQAQAAPKAAPAKAPAKPATEADVEGIYKGLAAKHGGQVPIHEVRAAVAARFGPDAASPAVFDPMLKRMRADGKLRLIAVSDGRDFTEKQHRDSIPGVNETLGYIAPKQANDFAPTRPKPDAKAQAAAHRKDKGSDWRRAGELVARLHKDAKLAKARASSAEKKGDTAKATREKADAVRLMARAEKLYPRLPGADSKDIIHRDTPPRPALARPSPALGPPAASPGPDVRAEAKRIHAAAASPSTSVAKIDALHPKLSKLSKAELLPIASDVGLVGMDKQGKGRVVDRIVDRIRGIKQSAVRTALLDRPVSPIDEADYSVEEILRQLRKKK